MRKLKELFSARKNDFRVDTFCSGGPGGQHQNKTESGVRITHIASGLSAESREQRSQKQNRRIAFERLAKLLIAHHFAKEEIGRYAAGQKVVRTYHECDDRIVDHDSKKEYSFKQTFGKNKMSKIIEERAAFNVKKEG